MVSLEEEKFLQSIPDPKKVFVKPFDPKVKEIGESIISKIKKQFSELEVLFMGSVALGIAGQNDIGIYALCEPREFDKFLPALKKIFGNPTKTHDTFIEWNFLEGGYQVEFYLTKPPQRQIDIFNVLKNDQKILKEYEDLKLSFNGKRMRDYQKAKYEFYSKIMKNHD
ncbi:MAG: hypothetical protein US96_C0012G0013 [Candidatus Woesebacteria bacterium GW2011_GWB1_38_5b]|uniref:Polymerase nucleotidyl transferase domain-containing protein n=1 Tax=Candidatus Woesebacteria bacterium GW2011_GWB1_38_5b TaxID=1618569 RepID=A0A0G0MNX6_9BACT|nr:MAG: hypothetical protein US96_C0012G0013 [Candidatus Woesebacteria bacterium GW2011_GWB1_38_5b]